MNMNLWSYEISEVLKYFTGWIESDAQSSFLILFLMVLPLLLMSWILGTSLFESIGGSIRVILGAAIPLAVGLVVYVGSIIYMEHQFEREGMFHTAQWAITILSFLIAVFLISKPLFGLGLFKTLSALFVMAVSAYGGHHLGLKLVEQSTIVSQQTMEKVQGIVHLPEEEI